MRERLLARIGELCVDNPWVVIGVWALLGLGSALALPSIEIASSRFELIAGEDAFVDARGARTDLVVTVTAEDPAAARAAADDLAERLRELPATHAVLHRIDPRWWRGQEVLFVPTDELAALASGGPRADDLASMVEAARAGLATDSDETLDSLDPAPPPPSRRGSRSSSSCCGTPSGGSATRPATRSDPTRATARCRSTRRATSSRATARRGTSS